MQAAIWEVSNKIGNNWTAIYMKLPFMPDRTQEKRAEDIKSKNVILVKCRQKQSAFSRQ